MSYPSSKRRFASRRVATLVAALLFAPAAAAHVDNPKQIAFVWPAQGTITATFGPQPDGSFHRGLDIGILESLEIDAKTRTAWADAGLTAAEYSIAADAHGLATGFGDTGSVGIGGITLGGGVGYLVRKYGLAVAQPFEARFRDCADGQNAILKLLPISPGGRSRHSPARRFPALTKISYS